MPTAHIDQGACIFTDDVGCARRLNVPDVSVLDTSDDRGCGVFAARNFVAGEVVIIGLLDSMERLRTTNSIQLSWDAHALFEKPATSSKLSKSPSMCAGTVMRALPEVVR